MLHEPISRLNHPRSAVRGAPSARLLLGFCWDLIREQWVVFCLLAVWAFGPLAELVINVARHGGVLTGAYGWDPFDQLAYLAWIRDEGSHVLASNLWQIGYTPHDYLHPMWVISGLLWRLGASVQLSYVVWTPVALLVLFLGCAAYVKYLLVDSRHKQAAALVVGLFYLTPVLAIGVWLGALSPSQQESLVLATDDANSALNLWGFAHTAIMIGLMPVFLMSAERLLEMWPDGGRAARGWAGLCASAGLLVSWLHPWQGLMLLAIVAGLAVFRSPRRRCLALIVPVAATLLPLIYGEVLAHADPSWGAFQSKTIGTGTGPWWALLASFAPLVALAALGTSYPRSDREWMLVLWVASCAGVYFLVPEFPPHALSGVTLPLAVLAVRGWSRLRLPRQISASVAVGGILLFTVPAAVYHAQSVRDDLTDTTHASQLQLLELTSDQASALSYLSAVPRPGAVLAPLYFSMSVPAFTGREVYAGHFMWQPRSNDLRAAIFFDPALNDPTGRLRRAILTDTKATFVLADCGAPATLATAIAPLTRVVKRFGCVTLYETSPAHGA